jgi:glycosyltransferase involved in cell wall biosynthesis
MCVYNGDRYIKEAVQSILSQTYPSFEFIIVNDGSTDRSAAILSSFADPRIKIINNETNLGLIRSLNIGLDAARGELIARMDADDISDPRRFEKQVAFLDNNSDIGVCGTWLQIIGEKNLYTFPLMHDEIKVALLGYNPVAHPSVMFRAKVLKLSGSYYDIRFPGAEDYELWTRAIFATRFANIGETLLFYRKHNEQVTQNKKEEVNITSQKIKINLLRAVEIYPDERETMIHSFLFNDQFKELRITGILKEADDWMHKIFLANRRLKQFDERLLLGIWRSKLFVTCIGRYDLAKWRLLKRSWYFKSAEVSAYDKFKIFMKCLIRRRVG